MQLFLLTVLVLVFSYSVLHYALSTFWRNPTAVIITSAVFAVLIVIFVSLFGLPAIA